MSVGIISPIAAISEGSNSTTAVTICGKTSAITIMISLPISTIAVTMSGNTSVIAVTISGSTSAIALIMLVTASTAFGKIEETNLGIASAILGAKPSISLTTPPRATSTLGIKFSAKVPTESMKFVSNASKSAVSSAMPTSKFCQAAFIIAQEPWIVVPASLAVVPAIPMLCCITLIALTMLSKDILLSSTVMPNCFCTSVILEASAINRAISSLVPP